MPDYEKVMLRNASQHVGILIVSESDSRKHEKVRTVTD